VPWREHRGFLAASPHGHRQTGPDKGAGGRYLVLGPNDPDMQPEGYYVVRSPTINIWSGHRALDPDPAKARAAIAGLRIYPYSERGNPPPTRHVSPEGRKWSGEQPRDSRTGKPGPDHRPGASDRARPHHARHAAAAGHRKGQAFHPTARQKQILIEAAQVGELMARTIGFEKRFDGAKVWPASSGRSRCT